MGKTKPTKKPRGRATVRGIAAAAGVSIGSVSSVLNNRHVERRIAPETVEKIRAAAAGLGYLPNISAKRLRSGGRNNVVLALVTSFEAPIPLVNHFIIALRAAMAAGKFPQAEGAFSVMIEMFPAGRLHELPGLLTGDHFNAAILLNTTAEDDAFLNRSPLPYPVVLVNRLIAGYAAVVEAPETGSRAAEILIRAKRSRLAVLHGSPLTQTTRARVNGFMHRGAELLGRPAHEVMAGKLSETAGYDAMRAFLKRGPEIDGLYAVSDALALGAYRALKEHGLKIPQDVAVVGVGDYEISPFFDPPLTSVGVSHQALAEEASRLLLQQLGGDGAARPTVTVPLAETLRASSGHRAG
jgi:LacI family transcriptional regulator